MAKSIEQIRQEELERMRQDANAVAGGQQQMSTQLAPATNTEPVKGPSGFPFKPPTLDIDNLQSIIKKAVDEHNTKYGIVEPTPTTNDKSTTEGVPPQQVKATERDKMQSVVDNFKKEIEETKNSATMSISEITNEQKQKSQKEAEKYIQEKTTPVLNKYANNIVESIFDAGKTTYKLIKGEYSRPVSELLGGGYDPTLHTPGEVLLKYNELVKQGKERYTNPGVAVTADIVAKIEQAKRIKENLDSKAAEVVRSETGKLDVPKSMQTSQGEVPIVGDALEFGPMGLSEGGMVTPPKPIVDQSKLTPTEQEQYKILSDYSWIKDNDGMSNYFNDRAANEAVNSFMSGLMPWYDEGDMREAQMMKRYAQDIKWENVERAAKDNPDVMKMAIEMNALANVNAKEREDYLTTTTGQVINGVANMVGMMPMFTLGGSAINMLKAPLINAINPSNMKLMSYVMDIAKLQERAGKMYDLFKPAFTFMAAEAPYNISKMARNKENKKFNELLHDFVSEELDAAKSGMIFHMAGKPTAFLQKKGLGLISDLYGETPLTTHQELFTKLTENFSPKKLVARGTLKIGDIISHAITGDIAGIAMGMDEKERLNQAITFAVLALGPSASIKERIRLTEIYTKLHGNKESNLFKLGVMKEQKGNIENVLDMALGSIPKSRYIKVADKKAIEEAKRYGELFKENYKKTHDKEEANLRTIEQMGDIKDITDLTENYMTILKDLKSFEESSGKVVNKIEESKANRIKTKKAVEHNFAEGGIEASPRASGDKVEEVNIPDISIPSNGRPLTIQEKAEAAESIAINETVNPTVKEAEPVDISKPSTVKAAPKSVPELVRETKEEPDPFAKVVRVTTNSGLISIHPNGKMFYANGNEVTTETVKNKALVKADYKENRRVKGLHDLDVYVLPDERIISLSESSAGKEILTKKEDGSTAKKRNDILEQVKKQSGGQVIKEEAAIPFHIEAANLPTLNSQGRNTRSGDHPLSPVYQRPVKSGETTYNSILGAYISKLYPEAQQTFRRQDLYKMELRKNSEEPVNAQSASGLDAYMLQGKIAETGGRPESRQLMKEIVAELYNTDTKFREAVNEMDANTILGTKNPESYWNKEYPALLLEVRKEAAKDAVKKLEQEHREAEHEIKKEISAKFVDAVKADAEENVPQKLEKAIQENQARLSNNGYEDYGNKSHLDRLKEQITYTHMEPFIVPELRLGANGLFDAISTSITQLGYQKAKEDFINRNMEYASGLAGYNPDDIKAINRLKIKYGVMFYNWSKYVRTPVAVAQFNLNNKNSSSVVTYFTGDRVPKGMSFRTDLVPRSFMHSIADVMTRFGSVLGKDGEVSTYEPVLFDHNEFYITEKITDNNIEFVRSKMRAGDKSMSVLRENVVGEEYGRPIIQEYGVFNPDAVQPGYTMITTKRGNLGSMMKDLKSHTFGDYSALDTLSGYLKSGLFVWNVDDKNQPIAFRIKGIESLLNNEYGAVFQEGYMAKRDSQKNIMKDENGEVIYTVNSGAQNRIYRIFNGYNSIYKNEPLSVWNDKLTFNVTGWNKSMTVRELFNQFTTYGDGSNPPGNQQEMMNRVPQLTSNFMAMVNEAFEKTTAAGSGLTLDDVHRKINNQLMALGEKTLLKMIWMSEAAKIATVTLGGKTNLKPDGSKKSYTEFIKEVSKFVEKNSGLKVQKRMAAANKTDPTPDMDRAAEIVNRVISNGGTYVSRENGKDYIHFVVMDEEALAKPENKEILEKKYNDRLSDQHLSPYMEDTFDDFVERIVDKNGNFAYDGSGVLIPEALNIMGNIHGQEGKGKSLKVFTTYLGDRSDDVIGLKLAFHGQHEDSYFGKQLMGEDGVIKAAGIISCKGAKFLGAKYSDRKWDCISPITESNIIKIPIEEIRLMFDSKIHDEAPGPNHNVNGVMSEATYKELGDIYETSRPKTVDPNIRRVDMWRDVIANAAQEGVEEVKKVQEMILKDPAGFIDQLAKDFEKEEISDPYYEGLIEKAKELPNLIYTHEYIDMIDDAMRVYIKRVGQGRSKGSPLIFSPYDKHTAMLGTYILGAERYLLKAGERNNVSEKAEIIGRALFMNYGRDKNTGKVRPGQVEGNGDFQGMLKNIIGQTKIGSTIKFNELSKMINEMIKEGYDDKGNLKDGYSAVGSEAFRVNNSLFEDGRHFIMTIPGETANNLGASTVISKLPSNSHSLSVMYNTKVAVGLWGKDFDIDKLYIMANSKLFGGNFDKLFEWESNARNGKYELLKDVRKNDLGTVMTEMTKYYESQTDKDGKPLYTPEEAGRLGRKEATLRVAARHNRAYGTRIDERAADANANPYMGSSLFWEKNIENFQTKDIGIITNIRKELNNASMANLGLELPVFDVDEFQATGKIKPLEGRNLKVGYNPENPNIVSFNAQEPSTKTNSIDAKQGHPGSTPIIKDVALGNLLIENGNFGESYDNGPLNISNQRYTASSVIGNTILDIFDYHDRIRRGKDELYMPINAFGLLKEIQKYKIHKARLESVIAGDDKLINGIKTKQWLANKIRENIRKYGRIDDLVNAIYKGKPPKSKQDARINVINELTNHYVNSIWGKLKLDIGNAPATVIMDAFSNIPTNIFDENLAKNVRLNAYKNIIADREVARQTTLPEVDEAHVIANAGIMSGGTWTKVNEKSRVIRLKDMFDKEIYDNISKPEVLQRRKQLYSTLVDEMFDGGLPGFSDEMLTAMELSNAGDKDRGGRSKAYDMLGTMKRKWGERKYKDIAEYEDRMRSLEEITPDGIKRIFIVPAMTNKLYAQYKKAVSGKTIMSQEDLSALVTNKDNNFVIEETVVHNKFGKPTLTSAKILDPIEFFDKDNPKGYKFWFNDSENGIKRVDALEAVSKGWIDAERKTKILTDYVSGNGYGGLKPNPNALKGIGAILLHPENSGLQYYNKNSRVNTIGPAVAATAPKQVNVADRFYRYMNDAITNVNRAVGKENSNVSSPQSAFAVAGAGMMGIGYTPSLGIAAVAGLAGLWAKARHSAEKYTDKETSKKVLAEMGNSRIKVGSYIKQLHETEPAERLRYVTELITKYEKGTGGDLSMLKNMVSDLGGTKQLSRDMIMDTELSIVHFLNQYNAEIKHAKKTFGNNIGIMVRNFVTPLAFTKYYGKNNIGKKASDEFLKIYIHNPFMRSEEKAVISEQTDVIYNHIINMLGGNQMIGKDAYFLTSAAMEGFGTAMFASQNLQTYKEMANKLHIFAEDKYANVDMNNLMNKIVELQSLGISFDGNRMIYEDSTFDVISSSIFKKGNDYRTFTGVDAKYIISQLTVDLDKSLNDVAIKIGLKKQASKEMVDLGDIPQDELNTTKKALLMMFINKTVNRALIEQAYNNIYAISDKYDKLGMKISPEEVQYINKKRESALWEIDNNAFLPVSFTSEANRQRYYKQMAIDHFTYLGDMYKKILGHEKEINDIAKDPAAITGRSESSKMEEKLMKKSLINMYGFFTNGTYGRYTPSNLEKMSPLEIGKILEYSIMGRWQLKPEDINSITEGDLTPVLDKIDRFAADKAAQHGMVDILDPGYSSLGLTGTSNNYDPMLEMKGKDVVGQNIEANTAGLLKDSKIFGEYSDKLYNSLNRSIVNQVAHFAIKHMDLNGEHPAAKEQTMKYFRNLSGSTHMFTKEKELTTLKRGEFLKMNVNDELRNNIEIKSPFTTVMKDEEGNDIVPRLNTDAVDFTGVVKDNSNGIITFVKSVNDLDNPLSYKYVLDTNRLQSKYKALTPHTDDVIRKVIGSVQRVTDAIRGKRPEYEGMHQVQSENGKIVQGVAKTINLLKTTSSTMLLGGLNMPNYIMNNVINAGYGSLYGPQAMADYASLMAKNAWGVVPEPLQQVNQAINSSSLLSFFSDQVDKPTTHTRNALNAARRIFKSSGDQDIIKSGMLRGGGAVIEMLAETMKAVQKLITLNGTPSHIETNQRKAIGQERVRATMGEGTINEQIANIAALNAIWMYTGLYSAEGRPAATSTIAGQMLNLFMPWRSARMSRWFATLDRQFTQAIEKELGQTGVFKESPYLKTKGSKMSYKSFDSYRDKNNNTIHKTTVRYDNIWDKSTKRTAAELATSMALHMTTSFLVGGLAYSVAATIAGREEAEDIYEKMNKMSGLWGLVGNMGEISAKYLNISRMVGDPTLSAPMSIITLGDALARIDNKKNSNKHYGKVGRIGSAIDKGDSPFSFSTRHLGQIETMTEVLKGEDPRSILMNVDSETLDALKNTVSEFGGVGTGVIGDICADLIGIGMTVHAGKDPLDLNRWIRTRLENQMIDDMVSPFVGFAKTSFLPGNKMGIKHDNESTFDATSRLLFGQSSFQPVSKGNRVSKQMVEKTRKKYSTENKNKEDLENLLDALQ